MALAEFLKQIDLEELYEGKVRIGSSGSERSRRDPQLQSLEETSKIHDTEAEVSPAEPVAVSTSGSSQAKRSSTTEEDAVSNKSLDNSTNEGQQALPSSDTVTRVVEDDTQRRERRLHSLIDEMWSLIPEEKKRGGSQFSRREKIEIASEHLRSVQDK